MTPNGNLLLHVMGNLLMVEHESIKAMRSHEPNGVTTLYLLGSHRVQVDEDVHTIFKMIADFYEPNEEEKR